jgi:DNA-directed RNA polymerase specialized sigma subunit
MDSLQDLEDYLQSNGTTTEEYENIELKGIINGFVKSLPRRQRYIFIFKYYYFDTIPEIAKALDVSESTVSKEIADINRGRILIYSRRTRL